MKNVARLFVISLLLCGSALAQSDSHTAAEASKLSEGLVFSVSRVPERPFETARAVRVITREEIWRKNATSLSDILNDEPGFLKYRTSSSAASPLLRGMVGRQIMLLIDGVKVNNTLAGDTPNMDIVDVSQIERIEIVRGVVSVLGTESLGGVINVITRKGAGDGISGSLGLQYSSAAEAISTALQAQGSNSHFRWNVGANVQRFGEQRGGEGIGVQRFTDYNQNAVHASGDYFISTEKTLSASFRQVEQQDVQTNGSLVSGSSLVNTSTPIRMQLGTFAYQDLTDRGWAESLRVTAYMNQQDNGTETISRNTPTRRTMLLDEVQLLGINTELGTFVGNHHLVYGVDLTRDEVTSVGGDRDEVSGVITPRRGRYTDGAKYSTLGVYLQDQFAFTKWVTATAGIRYGVFKTEGTETLPVIGVVDLDQTKSDFTGALNVVFHATPTLNVVANAMRGFRAPNLRDISRFSLSSSTIEVPATSAEAERMNSYELGVKYENSFLSGSAFYFRNEFSNMLITGDSTYNGMPFVDANGNGVRDAGEPAVRRNNNLGEARLDGWEADVRVTPISWLSLAANYTQVDGHVTSTRDAALIQRVPPPYGAASIRVTPAWSKAPWAEFVYGFNRSFETAGTVLTPSTKDLKLRAGFTPFNWLKVAISGENLTDEKYIPRFTNTYHAGRRLVLTTELRF
ncbi:MAG TPA: TonB-dependent receptor [Thermoanaerobaculia bacterium]|nr:TonB-dependent receptor [Thermoanaerobaculia bacterium]